MSCLSFLVFIFMGKKGWGTHFTKWSTNNLRVSYPIISPFPVLYFYFWSFIELIFWQPTGETWPENRFMVFPVFMKNVNLLWVLSAYCTWKFGFPACEWETKLYSNIQTYIPIKWQSIEMSDRWHKKWNMLSRLLSLSIISPPLRMHVSYQ